MDTTLGARIKALRELRKMTQEELAEKCSVSSSCVSRWENNHLRPKTANIRSLSKVLETEESSFYVTPSAPLPENLILREAVTILSMLEYDEQQYFLNMLKSYQKMKRERMED